MSNHFFFALQEMLGLSGFSDGMVFEAICQVESKRTRSKDFYFLCLSVLPHSLFFFFILSYLYLHINMIVGFLY